jgi:hypothetical protein
LLAKVRAGVDAVAAAARSGVLRVDDELHLSVLPAEDEDPEVIKLRTKLDLRIGEVQLPEVILAVDAQVRFSWIMLGREPRSTEELLMVYAGIMAHGNCVQLSTGRVSFRGAVGNPRTRLRAVHTLVVWSGGLSTVGASSQQRSKKSRHRGRD